MLALSLRRERDTNELSVAKHALFLQALESRNPSPQQFTYGIVSEGFFLQKFCGKFAEISKNSFYCVMQERAEICPKFSAITPTP